MAASNGYECNFIDSVFGDLYCKKCSHVARRLTIAACCGESFCHVCITDTKKKDEPCPECGEKNFTTFEQVKNQKRINSLCVYCSMKERGCEWSGTLEQLDTHLDFNQDNCQYVDTKCPLFCHSTIPKNKVEQHVALHCTKRPYVCQHCNFKATYEEIVDTHLPECKYVPLPCPNQCGVTFERDFMEDHMKICRLEEVRCDFSGVGCEDLFKREDQEEHTRQNSHKHLTLTASLAVETKEQLLHKLLEQDKQHKEEEEKLKQTIKDQDKKIEDHKQKAELQENKLKEQELTVELQQKTLAKQSRLLNELEKKHKEQNQTLALLKEKLEDQIKKLEKQEKNIIEQKNERKKEEQKLKENMEQQKLLLEQQFHSTLQKLDRQLKEVTTKSFQNESQYTKIFSMISPNLFEMKCFSCEKAKNSITGWKSPAMYTHVCGYQFCIGVDANGYGSGRGKSINVALWIMSGDYDDQLKWPAKAKFTVELVDQQGGENVKHSTIIQWNKPTSEYNAYYTFGRIPNGFLEHSKLSNFLRNDTLHFHVSDIKLL